MNTKATPISPTPTLATLSARHQAQIAQQRTPFTLRIHRALSWLNPKTGSYPVAGSVTGGVGGPMTGAMRSLM